MSTIRYLHHCRTSDQWLIDLLSQETEYRGRYKGMNNTIATTWLVSFNHILRDQPLAADILLMISFIVKKDIPLLLFSQGNDELEVDEAIWTLKAYAFITERKMVIRLTSIDWSNWRRESGCGWRVGRHSGCTRRYSGSPRYIPSLSTRTGMCGNSTCRTR
jgi:hypothetical protein